MCVIESFTVGYELKSIFAGKPGLVRLDAAQVLAVMASLPLEQQAFLGAISGDKNAESLLWGWLYQKAAGKAAQEGWKVEKGVERIGGLARVVCGDMLRMDGRLTYANEVAAMMKISRAGYYKNGVWPLRYQWLNAVGEGIVDDCRAELARQFPGVMVS